MCRQKRLISNTQHLPALSSHRCCMIALCSGWEGPHPSVSNGGNEMLVSQDVHPAIFIGGGNHRYQNFCGKKWEGALM